VNEKTRNAHDGCVQCLPSGPDTLPSSFSLPKTIIHRNKSLFSPLTKDDTGHPDYFNENKNFRRQKASWRTKKISVDPIVAKWIEPRKKIPTHQTTLFIVISNQNNSLTNHDKKIIQTIHPKQKEKYFVPFLSSAMEKGSPFVKFHCLSQLDLSLLKKRTAHGFPAGTDGTQFDDYVSSQFPSHHVELLCVDDIYPNNVRDYHHSSNVYAGGTSFDIVDNTYQEIQLRNGELKAYYKFGQSNQFLDQVPLSTSFFDSSFHKFKLTSHHARMFVGKKFLSIHFIHLCFTYFN
jgi:hypothetical protein